MQIEFSDKFNKIFDELDEVSQDKVMDFVEHLETHGFRGLVGRNKSSALPNPHTKKERADFAYAQKYCLWHYHIGLPFYLGDDGDKTSEYILHYQRLNEKVVIVALTTHPPFTLPIL